MLGGRPCRTDAPSHGSHACARAFATGFQAKRACVISFHGPESLGQNSSLARWAYSTLRGKPTQLSIRPMPRNCSRTASLAGSTVSPPTLYSPATSTRNSEIPPPSSSPSPAGGVGSEAAVPLFQGAERRPRGCVRPPPNPPRHSAEPWQETLAVNPRTAGQEVSPRSVVVRRHWTACESRDGSLCVR